MIAKRLAAIVVTVGLIVGALVVRDQVIDGDGNSDQSARSATVLVCASEFKTVCDSIEIPGVTISIEQAGDTLDRLAATASTDDVPMWLTFDPFPAMVALQRTAADQSPLALDARALGSSPIALVTVDDGTIDLTTACGDPVSLRCLGDSQTAVGFARSTDSGIGLLGVVQATSGYGSASGVPLADARFQRWLRGLVTGVSPSQLSGGTAIATIQTRPSSMDVAVGAVAELGVAQRTRYAVQYAEPMIRADVVLALPPGASIAADLSDALTAALVADGWDAPSAAPNPLPDPTTVIAVRSLWKELV